MASTRKPRYVNKRFSKANDDSPDKEGGYANKSKIRKRKLSDMLGSQWSKEELERFYDAYRKHGRDWKKVAGSIRNRSIDMVEALYNMNKAYLSLPDGMATAAGLIAMMTDHYNNLDGSDSDPEINNGIRTSNKSQKRARMRQPSHSSKGAMGHHMDLLSYPSSPSNFGCLSILKKKRSGGSQPRVVGKRTPRYPVSYAFNKNDKGQIISSEGRHLKSERDADEDEGAHVAALALAEASQRGSPQASRTPGSKIDNKSCERKLNEQCSEDSLESREAENDGFSRDINHILDSESAGPVATKRKVRKSKEKKSTVGSESQCDDVKEACSGTEEGLHAESLKDEVNMEFVDKKGARGSHGLKRRSRQLFFGDENTAFDALQTLADISLNILLPNSVIESESSVQVKEEQRNFNDVEKPKISEKMPKGVKKGKKKYLNKDKSHSPVADVTRRKSVKFRKTTVFDYIAPSEAKLENDQLVAKIQKRKRKTSSVKAFKNDVETDTPMDESRNIEISAEEGRISSIKSKRSGQITLSPKQMKESKLVEYSSSSTDMGKTPKDAGELAPQVSATNEVCLTTKHQSRRKLNLKKAMARMESKSLEGAGENRLDRLSTSVNDQITDIKEKLSRCLSCPLLRKWCTYEWFYSAIDYPWFAKSEFVEYLNHVGLGHVPRLTRVEWGVIRSSLGKPRRLSQQFLLEEREKLQQYRDSVRKHYIELRTGINEGLPADLAQPLSVGQRVIACHPKTKEIHDGSVLTVDSSRCRVQFDRPEFGVEFVMDIDCMPFNPSENMPDSLRRRNLIADMFYEVFNEKNPYDHMEWRNGSFVMLSSNEIAATADGSTICSASTYPMNTLMKHAKGDTLDAIVRAKAAANEVAIATRQAMYAQPCTLAQIQAREDDIRALAEMTKALDKKEALLMELRRMNEEVSLKQMEGDNIKDLDHFRKQYAMVLLQLREANDLVASALVYLRQRNTYLGNSTPPRLRPLCNSTGPTGPPVSFSESAFHNRDSVSNVIEIVESSRRKANTMVGVAFQALSSLKEGEESAVRISEALDSSKKYHSGTHTPPAAIKSCSNSELASCNSTAYHDQTEDILDQPPSNDAQVQKLYSTFNGNLPRLPSELISSCISTFLMIQRCSERQYPPAEVAQILESAATSLLPCCSQNLPIYRDIEVCMGIIKNQMLALVPTPSVILPTEQSIL